MKKEDYHRYLVTNKENDTYIYFFDYQSALATFKKDIKNQSTLIFGLVDLSDEHVERYIERGDVNNCYKFRGWSTELQRWVYGFLSVDSKNQFSVNQTPVVDASLGRCLDVLGLPILFSGDVVKAKHYAGFDDDMIFGVVIEDEVNGWFLKTDVTQVPMNMITKLEIIGNTFRK